MNHLFLKEVGFSERNKYKFFYLQLYKFITKINIKFYSRCTNKIIPTTFNIG